MAKINFDKMDLPELVALRAELDKEIEQRQADVRAEFKTQIEQQAKNLGIDLASLFGAATKRRGAKAGQSVAPKYKDPATGQTWSGRGREPAWIKGKDRDKYQIAA